MHHWSDAEKTSARQMIVEMVCRSVTARALCADSAQMETYKGRIPETSNAPPPPQQGAARSRLLTAHLNLPTMNIVQRISGIQTVEQELSAYLATEVTAGTDPIAFWHVSEMVFHFHGLQCTLLRCPAPHFRHYFKSLWTTYRFKRLRFHANKFSPPVPRR